MKHQLHQINGYRAVILPLIVILLIPTPVILNHLDRPHEYAGLAIYIVMVLGLGFSAVSPREQYYRWALPPLRWLQQRWVLLVIILWALLEVWYLQQNFLTTFRSHEKTPLLLTWTLLLVWLAAVLLFAGRRPDEIKRLVGNLLVGGISLFLSILVLGLGLAIVDYGDYQERHKVWWKSFEPDPEFGWRHPPYAQLLLPVPQGEDPALSQMIYQLDDLGLRNSQPRQNADIAVLGSSFTFAPLVEDDQTWFYLLSEELGVDVANYSVSAYTMWQTNLLLEKYACNAGHRLMIYNITPLDFQNTSNLKDNADHYYRMAKLYRYRTPFDYSISLVFEMSPLHRLKQLASKEPDEEAEPIKTMTNGLQLIQYNPLLERDNYEAVSSNIEHLLTSAIQMSNTTCNMEMVVVPIPSREAVYADAFRELYPEPGADERIVVEEMAFQQLCEIAESQGVFCYNMLDDMRALAAQDDEPFYFSIDGHLNARGNQAITDLITAYLQEQNLFDEE